MILTFIIALGACVLVVVLLAIAFVVPTDDESIVEANRRTPSPLFPRRQVTIRRGGTTPSPKDDPARRTTLETRTTPASNPAWRGIAEASMAWLRKLFHDLTQLRAWRRRRTPEAGWVAAGVALSVAIGYLIVHI